MENTYIWKFLIKWFSHRWTRWHNLKTFYRHCITRFPSCKRQTEKYFTIFITITGRTFTTTSNDNRMRNELFWQNNVINLKLLSFSRTNTIVRNQSRIHPAVLVKGLRFQHRSVGNKDLAVHAEDLRFPSSSFARVLESSSFRAGYKSSLVLLILRTTRNNPRA